MKLKKVKKAILVFILTTLCVNLMACSHNHSAYFQGQYLYIDGEKYIQSSGIYHETNRIICKTEDNVTIYEVDGDIGYNYVVARTFLDQSLYVKESYVKDKTEIEGLKKTP